MHQFRNLVFKGGGVKGVAYIGAMSVLEEMGLVEGILRTCGTSSGSIMAATVALGGTAAQLAEVMCSRFLRGLLDGSKWPVRNLGSLIQDYGWHRGKRLSHWMKRHVEQLSGIPELTFAGLERLHAGNPMRFKQLTVIASNVTIQCPHVFDSSRTPNTPIWEALRASMSIPFLFPALRDELGNILVDGGLTWNYPLDIYDSPDWLSRPEDTTLYSMIDNASDRTRRHLYNKQTLGFMVETRSAQACQTPQEPRGEGEIGSFGTYMKAMIGLMTDSSTSSYLNQPDWQRTVFIEAHGTRSTDFSLPDSMIAKLIDSGRQSALDYFTWFKDPANAPLNRVDSPTGAA